MSTGVGGCERDRKQWEARLEGQVEARSRGLECHTQRADFVLRSGMTWPAFWKRGLRQREDTEA